MNIALFFIVFICLGIVYTIIGLYASKNIKTNTDYFLAGRDLGLWPLIFTLLATQIGGGMLLGTTQEAYNFGLYGFTYTIGMSIGFILLGCGFAQKLQALNVSTTAELFETRYHSLLLKKIASFISIATMTGILLGQIIGSKKLLLSIGVDNEYIFIIFWFFTIWYTMAGGLKAVVWTDTIQILFIICLFSSLFIYNIWCNPSSLRLIFNHIPIRNNGLFTVHTAVGTILMPMLFSLIEQDLAQRFFAARTQAIARISSFGAAFGLVCFSCIPVYFGIQAHAQGLIIGQSTSPLIPYLTTISNDFVLVLAACAIIAAITSTADSLLCAISSHAGQDFDLSFLTINVVQRSRIITMIIGCTALVSSYFVSHNIIQILVSSYELSVSCLFVPLIVCYFKSNIYKSAAIGSIIAGLIGFIGLRLMPIQMVPREIITLILSLVGYYIGHTIRHK